MRESISILHVIGSLRAGGAEKLLDEMLPVLGSYKKVKVELLLLSKENNIFLDKIKNSNIKVAYAPTSNPRSLKNIFFLFKYIKKNNFDIVHSHLFPEQYFISVVSFLFGKKETKFITTEHNTYNNRRKYKIFKVIEKIIYKQYDKIISITKETENNLLEWINPRKKELEKFEIINNGINIKEFSSARHYRKNQLNNGLNEEDILLCMVGRFTEQKDQQTILKSLKYLPGFVKLMLIGEGKTKQELELIIQKLELNNRVFFMGIRNDIPQIYKTIDIPIVSSNWEGFGLVAVEGMAACKPVIASNVPGLSEIVNGYGLLFEKGDSLGLSKAIKKLLDSNDFYEEIAEKCLKRSKKYDLNKMTDKYYNAYIELLM